MKQYPMTEQEIKQVAHFLAQKRTSGDAPGNPKIALNHYLEAYNTVIEELYEYNSKC